MANLGLFIPLDSFISTIFFMEISEKSELLSACIARQQENVEVARDAVSSLREVAHSERSGEELTDGFSAQCNNDQAMYTRRMEEASGLLNTLEKARYVKPAKQVGFGSLVVTSNGKFFIAAGLGQFTYKKDTFLVISSQSPIFQAMVGKQEGDSFSFRGKKFCIEKIM